MYYVFIFVILVTNLLLKFLLNMFNNSTQRLASVATSIVRDHQFSTIHLRGLSLVLGLAQFFELRTNNWTSPRSSTEYGHSGLKYAQRRAPASRYIVAFELNRAADGSRTKSEIINSLRCYQIQYRYCTVVYYIT